MANEDGRKRLSHLPSGQPGRHSVRVLGRGGVLLRHLEDAG